MFGEIIHLAYLARMAILLFLILFALLGFGQTSTASELDIALRNCVAKCDLTGISGDQVIRSPEHKLYIPSGTTVYLGHSSIITNDVIDIASGATVIGPPAAEGQGLLIKAAPGFAPAAVVMLEGAYATLQNVVVDGNKSANPGADYSVISIMKAPRTALDTVTAMNGPKHGISIQSSKEAGDGGNESCCAKLNKVVAASNNGFGLYIQNTSDVFVSFSEFEENGIGAVLQSSSGVRIEHSDFGGSTVDGLVILGDPEPSLGNIIVGNQFGNNVRHDIAIWGQSGANLIGSNAFIGSRGRFVRQPESWGIWDGGTAGLNTIQGNSLIKLGDYPYNCIHFDAIKSKDAVSGNLCYTNPLPPPKPPRVFHRSKNRRLPGAAQRALP